MICEKTGAFSIALALLLGTWGVDAGETLPGGTSFAAPSVVRHAIEEEPELPEPPKGFSWQWCEAIESAFLRPEGWFFRKTVKGDTIAYFLTKEDIEKQGRFQTGLTVNVVKNIPEKTGVSPYQYAVAFLKETKKKRRVLREWDQDMGPFKSVGMLYGSKDEKDPVRVHQLLIANDETGTLFFFVFEAPTKEWDAAWKIGETILSKLLIDDEV